jgi:hypothetical protein
MDRLRRWCRRDHRRCRRCKRLAPCLLLEIDAGYSSARRDIIGGLPAPAWAATIPTASADRAEAPVRAGSKATVAWAVEDAERVDINPLPQYERALGPQRLFKVEIGPRDAALDMFYIV